MNPGQSGCMLSGCMFTYAAGEELLRARRGGIVLVCVHAFRGQAAGSRST